MQSGDVAEPGLVETDLAEPAEAPVQHLAARPATHARDKRAEERHARRQRALGVVVVERAHWQADPRRRLALGERDPVAHCGRPLHAHDLLANLRIAPQSLQHGAIDHHSAAHERVRPCLKLDVEQQGAYGVPDVPHDRIELAVGVGASIGQDQGPRVGNRKIEQPGDNLRFKANELPEPRVERGDEAVVK